MASVEADDQETNSWEELLRKMLPEGAPLPDEDQLDYSISVDYVGPSTFFNPPINLMIPKTKFTTFPKQPPSLTPRNLTWLKSRSSSDTTNSDTKRLSSGSIAFDDATDDDSSDGGVGAVSDHYDPENSLRFHEGIEEMKRRDCASSGGNKGSGCSRCGRGSHGFLRRRERCIVCGAEYCKKCVLKAMGSLPEGRKCVGCIGKPIDERNRGRLGKGPRLLGRLCSRLEVKQIMQAERVCKANQVKPDHVTVNGRELREEELEELLGCPVPPRGLKPGRYWYDKDSGLWGKEGEKPERIISSKLDVGGKLQMDASCGNTRVYMNGREITKVELRVLKLAKVQCLRDTHFWLYDDGSYEEEGQNNIKGCIWEKASIRFLCSLFSLPVPPASARCTKEEPAQFSARLFPEYSEQERLQKLFLVGLEGSGTITIFKQAKFIYTDKFTTEELQNKLIIRISTYKYLIALLEEMEHFQEEALLKTDSATLAADRLISGETKCDGSRQCMYSVNQKISTFCDWLLDLLATGDVGTNSLAAIINEIWKDSAVQEIYKRVQELKLLPDVAKYFLDRVIEISSDEYEPSEKDILLAEGLTPSNGLACIEFSFNDQSAFSKISNPHSERQQPSTKYQLVQLSCKDMRIGCFKWLEMFDSMSSIVLCVSLCDYDQLWTHSTTGGQQNKMLASRDFFERVARHFVDKPFLLLLTKYDLFEDKINQVPITVCDWFRGFDPIKCQRKSPSLAHQAYHFIAVKFKELYTSITGKKLYVRQIQAHEQTSVDEAFRYMREILEWDEHEDGDFYAFGDEDFASYLLGPVARACDPMQGRIRRMDST